MTNAALIAYTVIYTIARIITGEVSVVPEAALPVASVAYNRLDVWGYDGWHAIADEPKPWAIDAAEAAYWMWVRGESGGDLFALSDDDCRKLGVTWGTRHGDDRWGVTTFRRWP